MPKVAEIMSPIEFKALTTPEPKIGFHFVGGDGAQGLALHIKGPETIRWVVRMTIAGKRVDVGLGPLGKFSLAKARERARAIRYDWKTKGIDPRQDALDAAAKVRAERDGAAAAKAARSGALTFKQAATRFIASKSPEWKNKKHAKQWGSTLETHVYPKLRLDDDGAPGSMPVREIETRHILEVLEPIWFSKTETATRVRGRIEAILDWATVAGYRDGMNPARWKGHLQHSLANPSKVTPVVHHKALPYQKIGAFMRDLRQVEGAGARALELAILTAARSGEVRGALWDEIDLDERLWTIPGARMKVGLEHRVPLSDAAIDLLEKLPRIGNCPLVFPSTALTPISDMTLTAVMRRMNVDAVPHGFRSTFRDWASEATSFSHEAAEKALAHSIKNNVEAAYRRGDLLEKRRPMMADWAAYCANVIEPAKVTPIRNQKRSAAK